MSEDEDYNEDGGGKVQGPMLDYSRYYPTTLPMAKPRHDGSEAMSDEVRHSLSAQVNCSQPLPLCLTCAQMHSRRALCSNSLHDERLMMRTAQRRAGQLR